MTDNADGSAVFKRESFAEIALRARQVLREKGFSEDQIEALLSRPQADDFPDWWAPLSAKSGNGADHGHS